MWLYISSFCLQNLVSVLASIVPWIGWTRWINWHGFSVLPILIAELRSSIAPYREKTIQCFPIITFSHPAPQAEPHWRRGPFICFDPSNNYLPCSWRRRADWKSTRMLFTDSSNKRKRGSERDGVRLGTFSGVGVSTTQCCPFQTFLLNIKRQQMALRLHLKLVQRTTILLWINNSWIWSLQKQGKCTDTRMHHSLSFSIHLFFFFSADVFLMNSECLISSLPSFAVEKHFPLWLTPYLAFLWMGSDQNWNQHPHWSAGKDRKGKHG